MDEIIKFIEDRRSPNGELHLTDRETHTLINLTRRLVGGLTTAQQLVEQYKLQVKFLPKIGASK